MTYLLAAAVGPVQEFIAAARRCRDIWYGSRLLSEISKATALSLRQRGANLIFPSPERDEDLLPNSGFTVANKLLASIETSDIEDVVGHLRIAGQVRLEAAADLQTMRLRGTTINTALYHQQIQGTLEFYCAWTPLTEDYPASRRRVEELLAARKVLRDFPAYQGESGKYKSSLDGGRESVIEKRSKRLYESNLKANEYLDAIGIVKRFGAGTPRFDSTVDVAALPFVKGCQENGTVERKVAFRQYRQFLRGHQMSSETYSLLYEQESRQLFDEDEVATRELRELRAVIGKPNPPYYVLLLGDGDRMGQAISGLETADHHRKFSSALSGFAARAGNTIENDYGGCSIYCGGDDVLALLPMHTAIPCAQAINHLFKESLNAYDVTFSAGLVVAHGLEPLNEVRAWAMEAERSAKTLGGRDAVCITIYPRSGPPLSLCGKWLELAGTPEKRGILTEILNLHASEAKSIPRGFSYELRDLVERLKIWPELDPLLRKLVLAAARKKQCQGKALELIDEQAQDRPSIERLYRSMMVARWFARAEREAEGDAANDPH